MLSESDVDAFVRVSIDHAKGLPPWGRAEARLSAALRTLQRKGRITAERQAALVQELMETRQRAKDTRRH